MSGDDSRHNAIGFANLAKSYSDSADFLNNALDRGELHLSFDKPVDYLCAHAIELMLKACLLDRGENVRNYDHDLLKMYDVVRHSGDLISEVETAVKERWRHMLRSSRDELAAELEKVGVPNDRHQEFGIPDNNQIGTALPALREQIIWLSDRHTKNGGKFRYHKTEWDKRKQLQIGSFKVDVVRKSTIWACDEIYNRLRQSLSVNE